MKALDWFLDLLFPPKCAFCGRLLDGEPSGICRRCEKELPYAEGADALRTGAFGRCAAAFYYEGAVKEGIHSLKFGGRSSAARAFAPYLAAAAAEHFAGEFDAVTYVPVSARRLRQRGYDQSRLLAEAAAALWQAPAERTLEKTRDNPAQSTLSAEERRANVENAYAPAEGADIAGRRFLLIDDVLTTGSTLAACADTLRRAGAAGVVCAALATPRPAQAEQKEEG